MKQYSKLFSLAVLLCMASGMLYADDDNNNNNTTSPVTPFIQWRSQGRDMARKLYGTTSYAVYQPDMDNCNGTFNVTVQYDRSFRGKRITECLFGPALINNVNNNNNNSCDNDCGESIVISGLLNSNGTAATRAATELMAENFLLPDDFKSTISFRPRIQDVVVDFNLYVGLDRWVSGLYFRLYGPFVWNRADLRPSENIMNKGTLPYPEGFFDPDTAVPAASLFQSALLFFQGCQLPEYPKQSVTINPLNFAKWGKCVPNNNNNNNNNNCDDDCNAFRRTKKGFAELRGEFGYNYIADNYRFLINIQAAAPTGTRIKADFLLPAYVGNGHHWELGVGLGGAWTMWRNEDRERSFNFIVEADITHLFNAKQKRTFDLKCKPLSRYMLAEQLVTIGVVGDQLIPPTPQFSVLEDMPGVYMPVANFSTRRAKVSIGVQGDLVAMFNYTCNGFSWDLGYNFWAMSKSKIKLEDECNNNNDNDNCDNLIVPFPTNMALKGDASIAGYTATNGAVYGLGATENAATIFTGTNIAAGVGILPVTTPPTTMGGAPAYLTNPNIDNPTITPANGNNGTGGLVPLFAFSTQGGTPAGSPATPFLAPIFTSHPPVFISIDDLDLDGARQRGLSHKIFTHWSYTWLNNDRWLPYVGVGVSGEFGSHGGNDDCNTTTPECDPCPGSKSCALSKWAVEVKGGVSFH